MKGYVIVGPTASGKSDAAVELAIKLNGEVISGDSVQVYRGLDIGSGKITVTEMRDIPHHLIDVIDAGEDFSVEDFRLLGNQALEEIINRNKTPIIAGGTGFYIDTLVKNIKYPSINPKIKADLKNLDVRRLKNMVQEELPIEILESFDNNNPARLRNRLGLWRTHGYLPQPKKIKRNFDIDFTWLGINPDRKILEQNIINRTEKRLKDGMIQEVEQLLSNGISSDWLKTIGLEYRLVTEHLEQKTSAYELRQRIIQSDLQYTKRQLTWFKRNPKIKWFKNKEDLIKSLPSEYIVNPL